MVKFGRPSSIHHDGAYNIHLANICFCTHRDIGDLKRSAQAILECSAIAEEIEAEIDEIMEGDFGLAEELKTVLER